MMRSWDALPDVALRAAHEIGAELSRRGARTYRDAGRLVRDLPYGRTADRADPMLVLSEGRGTCSTKHALLARLAEEERLPVRLTLGLFEMSEANTPGVGRVLAVHGLTVIPEAHCYLTVGDSRVDVTFAAEDDREPIEHLLHEETLRPDQIGDYKVSLHRRFLAEWAAGPANPSGLDSESLWGVREACIAALAERA